MQPAQLQNVTKTYGPIQALNQVDLAIPQGEILALLGPNGAGKTTAVKLLLGLLTPTSGIARVFGQDPRLPANRRRTGAMLQVGRVPETLKVREHIDLFSSYYPNPLPIPQTLAAAGLADVQDRLYAQLSGGQKQRVLFALAICGDPDLVFLDEPTVGLDVEARRSLWEHIRTLPQRGKSVLLTTHYLEEADALASRVVVIDKGRIVANGSPTEIKRQTSGRKIRCATSLSVAEVRALRTVTQVSNGAGLLEIQTTDSDALVRELLRLDPTLTNLEITTAGLEEAFLALTQKETV